MTDSNLDKFNDRKVNQAIYFLFIAIVFFLTPLHFKHQDLEFTTTLSVIFSFASAISSVGLLFTLYQILDANSQ